MADQTAVSMPDWGQYVKTAVDRERPPTQENWWYLRTAAILRKVARNGPVGVNHLAQAFGGKKDNGVMPNTPGVASRHIIRTALQQLEDAGLVEKVPTKEVQVWMGRSSCTLADASRQPVKSSLTTLRTPSVEKPKHNTLASPSIDDWK